MAYKWNGKAFKSVGTEVKVGKPVEQPKEQKTNTATEKKGKTPQAQKPTSNKKK